MDGQRKALIVASDEYEHEGLRHLLAPAADAEALARVLGDSHGDGASRRPPGASWRCVPRVASTVDRMCSCKGKEQPGRL